MATPESKVKDAIRKIFKKYGVWYFMPATYGRGRSGVPDFIACARGRFISVEAKAGKGKATALQIREMNGIIASGGVAIVINEDNLDLLENLLIDPVFPEEVSG